METSAGYHQAVELEKIGCSCDRLSRLIFEGVIARDLDSKRCQALEVDEFECPVCFDFDQVQLVLDAARPDRLQRESVADLCEGAGALQACLEDLEFSAARAPAPIRGRATQWIPTLSGDAPDLAGETFWIDRLQRVEDAPIMNRPPANHVQV